MIRHSHGDNPRIGGKAQVAYMHAYLSRLGAKAIVVEENYFDRDFLQDFAVWHVRCFVDYRRTCARLHFFSFGLDKDAFEEALLRRKDAPCLQDGYLGFIVVKPLPDTVIGRSCLKVYPAVEGTRRRSYPTARPEHANLFGLDLHVDSLPFQEQDRDVAACASSALWTVLNGTSRIFGHPAPSPAEITRAATLRATASDRSFPADGGLTLYQVADAIRSVGLEPHAMGASDQSVLRIAVMAYIRLGIPCILLGPLRDLSTGEELVGHAVAVAGHSEGPAPQAGAERTRFLADRVDRLYCHDDQAGPFAKCVFGEEGLEMGVRGHGALFLFAPQSLLVPLYHKIRVPVADVVVVAQEFDALLGKLSAVEQNPFREGVIWDVRLTTVNDLRRALAASGLDDANRRRLLLRGYPRFIWVLEARGASGITFQAFLDATDLIQGNRVLDVAPFDGLTCKMLAAIAPVLREEVGARGGAAQLLDWFAAAAQPPLG